MGGFGATFLGSQLPGYFGSASSFSGLLQHQRPQVEPALEAFGARYQDVFGPQSGFYATGHNSTRLAANLSATRLYVTWERHPGAGGAVRPGEPWAWPASPRPSCARRRMSSWPPRGPRAPTPPSSRRPGCTTGPTGAATCARRSRGSSSGPVPEAPASWTYRTVARTGEMWGLRYRFAAAPAGSGGLSRRGGRLRATGAGTVTVENAAGCSLTAVLPFDRALPPPVCGRISVKVRPRRVRLGRTTRVRLRVTRVAAGRRFTLRGARIRIGGRTCAPTAAGARVCATARGAGPAGAGCAWASVGFARTAGHPRARAARPDPRASSPSWGEDTTTSSPALSHTLGSRAPPTPEGVPVATMSPGSSVISADRMRHQRRHGVDQVGRRRPPASPRRSASARSRSRRAAPASSGVTSAGPHGAEPSNTLPGIHCGVENCSRARTGR